MQIDGAVDRLKHLTMLMIHTSTVALVIVRRANLRDAPAASSRIHNQLRLRMPLKSAKFQLPSPDARVANVPTRVRVMCTRRLRLRKTMLINRLPSQDHLVVHHASL